MSDICAVCWISHSMSLNSPTSVLPEFSPISRISAHSQENHISTHAKSYSIYSSCHPCYLGFRCNSKSSRSTSHCRSEGFFHSGVFSNPSLVYSPEAFITVAFVSNQCCFSNIHTKLLCHSHTKLLCHSLEGFIVLPGWLHWDFMLVLPLRPHQWAWHVMLKGWTVHTA